MTADEEKTCPLCVTWLDQAYGELIQAIAQLGVLDTCGDLCGYAALRSCFFFFFFSPWGVFWPPPPPPFIGCSLLNSHLEGTICDLLCDYVGIEEFIKVRCFPRPLADSIVGRIGSQPRL